MPVAGSTAASCGATPVAMVGKRRPHPVVTVPLQVAALRRLSAVLQQERDKHLRPALVLRVRRGEGDREVPLFDDPAVTEVRDQHRDDDQAEEVVDQRGPQYRYQEPGVD